MKAILLVLVLVLLLSCSSKQPTNVLVLPSIHQAHENNKNYDYQTLFAVIRNFDPEVIGVEIRPEDIAEPNEYLEAFYPDEMIMVRDSFPHKVSGIDFYGSTFEGKLLPAEVFKDTTNELGRFVHQEKKLAKDTLVQRLQKESGIPEILREQKRITKIYSPQELLNGEYDSLTSRYYHLLNRILERTAYKEYADFNDLRDQRITANAISLIKENQGKRVLIIVGANHRARLVDAVGKLKKVQHQVVLSDHNMKKAINKEAPVVEKQQIFIDAPVEVVWKVLTQVDSWPQWQKQVKKVELLGPVKEGTKFDWRAGGINFKSQIHTCIPYSSFGWTGRTLGASAVHNWNFIPEKGGTVVNVEESLEGLFPGILKKKFRRELKAGMEKNLLELKLESERRKT